MKRHGRNSHVRTAVLGVWLLAASLAAPAVAVAGGSETSTASTQTSPEPGELAQRTVRHFVIAAMQIERLAKTAEKVDARVPQRVLNEEAKRIIDVTPHVDLKSYRALQRAVRDNERIRAHVQQTARDLREELRAEAAPSHGNAR